MIRIPGAIVLFSAVLIVLGSAFPVHAQDKSTAVEICQRLQDRFGIEFIIESGRVSKCTWKLDFQYTDPANKADQTTLVEFLTVFEREFSKYPPAFVKKTQLKQVAFVKKLMLDKQKRWALPDYFKETLYYDFQVRSVRSFGPRVIHHEYYHMIEEQFHGDSYFKDPKWAAFNEKGFKYGKGGAADRDPNLSVLNHPQPGFVNRYAMSGLEEDKAEIWSLLFLPKSWKQIERWADEDSILKNKIEYTEEFAAGLCPEMNSAYWERLRSPSRNESDPPGTIP